MVQGPLSETTLYLRVCGKRRGAKQACVCIQFLLLKVMHSLQPSVIKMVFLLVDIRSRMVELVIMLSAHNRVVIPSDVHLLGVKVL